MNFLHKRIHYCENWRTEVYSIHWWTKRDCICPENRQRHECYVWGELNQAKSMTWNYHSAHSETPSLIVAYFRGNWISPKWNRDIYINFFKWTRESCFIVLNNQHFSPKTKVCFNVNWFHVLFNASFTETGMRQHNWVSVPFWGRKSRKTICL